MNFSQERYRYYHLNIQRVYEIYGKVSTLREIIE